MNCDCVFLLLWIAIAKEKKNTFKTTQQTLILTTRTFPFLQHFAMRNFDARLTPPIELVTNFLYAIYDTQGMFFYSIWIVSFFGRIGLCLWWIGLSFSLSIVFPYFVSHVEQGQISKYSVCIRVREERGVLCVWFFKAVFQWIRKFNESITWTKCNYMAFLKKTGNCAGRTTSSTEVG